MYLGPILETNCVNLSTQICEYNSNYQVANLSLIVRPIMVVC